MPSAQAMLNRTSLVLPPQWTDEGAGAANYGKTGLLAGAVWTAPLQRGYLQKNNQPQYQENMFAGRLDTQGKFQVWNQEQVTLRGRLTLSDEALELFDWASNTTDTGKQGPANSRTWLYSYKDSSGADVWCIFKGCKPETCTLTINKDEGAMIELVMSCQYAYEVKKPANTSEYQAVGFAAAQTGLKTAENENVPIRFQEIGDFLYKPKATDGVTPKVEYTNIPFRAFTATISWGLRRQDSNGSDRDLFIDYGSRTCSGSASLFKAGRELNEDAKTDNLNVAILQIESQKSGEAHAFKKWGSTNELHIFALVPGETGENINVELKIGTASSHTPIVKVAGNDITVTTKTGGDTLARLKAAINGDRFASRLVTAGIKGTDTTAVTGAITKGALDGGSDKTRKMVFQNFKWEPSNEDLIEQTEATIEDKSYTADSQFAIVKASQLTT